MHLQRALDAINKADAINCRCSLRGLSPQCESLFPASFCYGLVAEGKSSIEVGKTGLEGSLLLSAGCTSTMAAQSVSVYCILHWVRILKRLQSYQFCICAIRVSCQSLDKSK